MSVRFIFRCQFCDAQPDPMTRDARAPPSSVT
jgi:hypothetical protein